MAWGSIFGGIIGIGLSTIFPGSAALWFAIGSTAGGILAAPTPPDVSGPRLENLTITTSGYGRDIPTVYGKAQVGGKYIASTDLIETSRRQKISSGGPFGKSQYQTTYHYHIDCAIAFAHGPGTIVNLWADGELIYNGDAVELTLPEPGQVSIFARLLLWAGVIGKKPIKPRLYRGSETQNPDPVVESIVGDGNASGYRGIIYVAFKQFQLEKYGNRPPNFTALIASEDPQSTGLIQTTEAYAQANPSGSDNDDWIWKFHLLGTFNDGALPGIFTPIDFQMLWTSASFSSSPVRSHMSWSPGGINASGAANLYAVYSEPQKIFNAPLGRGSVLLFNTWSDTMGQGGEQRSELVLLSRFPLHLNGQDLIFRSNVNYMISPENRPVICQCLTDTGLNRRYGDNMWFIDLSDRENKLGRERLVPINTDYASSWTDSSIARGLAIFGDHLYFLINNRDLVYHNLATGVQINLNTVTQVASDTGRSAGCWIDQDRFYFVYASTTSQNRIRVFEHGDDTPELDRDVSLGGFATALAAPLQVVDNIIWGVETVNLQPSIGRVFTLDMDSENDPLVREQPFGNDNVQWVADNQARINLRIDEARGLVRGWRNDSGTTYSHWYGFGNTYDDGVALSSIISDLCDKSGIAAADTNVTALAGTSVKGFLIDRKMSAKAAIEQLMSVYQFARQQLDGKLVFVDLTNVDEIEVEAGDLILNDSNGRLPFTTIPDAELPRAIDLSYLDSEREYEVNTVRALRGSSLSENIVSISVPVVMGTDEGAQRADILLTTIWTQRRTYSGSVPLSYLSALPANVLSTTVDGIVHKILLTKLSIGDSIQFEGVGYAPGSLVNDDAAGDAGAGQVNRGIEFSGPTLLEFLDINPLQSVDSGPGYYLAVSGVIPSWKGCLVYRSLNNGETYEPFDSFTESCIIGQTVTVLGAGKVGIFDSTNSVTIRITAGGAPEAAADDLAVLNGANLMVIGDEILQFRDVEDLGNGLYTLSHFLRGQQGTEIEMDNHFIGERVVVLKTGGVKFVPTGLSSLNSDTRFIATSVGEEFEPEEYQEFTYTGRILKPFTVHGTKAWRDASGNLSVTWMRRVRLNNDWLDFAASPLDEETEAYEVDVMDDDTVLATYTSADNPSMFTLDKDELALFEYSDALQTSDGVPDPDNIDLRIYQVSADIGRGHELEATV